MTKWSDAIFDEPDAALIQAQSPVVRPDPIPRPEPVERPGSVPRATSRQAPQQPAPGRFQFKPQDAPPMAPPGAGAGGGSVEPEQPKMRWSDSIFDDESVGPKIGPQAAPQRPGPAMVPFPGYKDPKQEGWLEWAANNVAGRKDPRFGDLPSIRDALDQEYQRSNAPWTENPLFDLARVATGGVPLKAPSKNWDNPYWHIALGAAMTNDGEGQANIVKKALGDRFISLEKDAYGADIVNYRDAGGLPKKAYVNKPGLEGEDVRDFIGQAVPYVATGRMLGSLPIRAGSLPAVGLQGLGGSSVSLLQDVGALMLGSEKAPDLPKAGVVGGATALVEGLSPVAGTLWRRLVTEPRLYNRQTGQLTEKGVEAARAAGMNPEDMTGDMIERFAKEYAAVRDPMIAGQTVRTREFDLPVTRGQMNKDPGALLNEKGMRYGAFGDAAKQTMQDFDRRQAEAIANAALGGGEKSVARMINPDRAARTTIPRDVGEGLQSGLTSARDMAKADLKEQWNKVGPQYATPEALDLLPNRIATELGDLAPLLGTIDRNAPPAAPTAKTMVDMLRKFRSGEPMREADDFLGGVTVPELDSMRRTLGRMMKGAQGSDREAAGAVYRGFNNWLQEAGERSLLAGDITAYQEAAKARDMTSRFKELFTAETLQGPATPGRKIVDKILNTTDNPESIVKALFGTDPGAVPKQGSVEAIRLIKRGVQQLPEDQAKSTINDLRLAHWMNVVNNSAGQLHTPTMIAQRIDKAFNSQASLMRELYEPQELALIRRFGAAMKDLAYKDPNPSGTGTANLFYASQWGQALMRMLGSFNGPLAKVMQFTISTLPIKESVGKVASQAATNPRSPVVNPSLGPIGGYLTDRRREASP